MKRVEPKLITATLVSPFVGALGGSAVVMVTGAITQPPTMSYETAAILPFVFVLYSLYWGGVVGLPAAIILGLPSHVALSRLRQRSSLAYGLAGAALGALVDVIVFKAVTLFNCGNCIEATHELLPSAIFDGAVTASCFWLIRRPDRDTANPANTAP